MSAYKKNFYKGVKTCLRYAFPPNLLGYCGPNEQKALKQHLNDKATDKEIIQILSHFESLFPYLRLISRENKIKDVFDYRVVEAYWIGNQFTKTVAKSAFKSFFKELLHLDNDLPIDLFYPNHIFHVCNIFKVKQRIDTNRFAVIDNCRIGWGKVLEIKKDHFLVQGYKISIEKNMCVLKKAYRILHNPYDNELVYDHPRIGDTVSYHWGTFCEVITEDQRKSLEYMTRLAIQSLHI